MPPGPRGSVGDTDERSDYRPAERNARPYQNLSGWARLCRLVSAAHGEAGDGLPVVSWTTLRAYADEDVVVILGPSAEPMRALSAGRPDIAEQ